MKKIISILLVFCLLSAFPPLSSTYVFAESFTKPVVSYPNNGNYPYFSKQVYFNNKWQYHLGIDLPASIGTPVCSILQGTVVLSGEYGFYGSLEGATGGAIVIRHTDNNGNTFYALYGHINRVDANGNTITVGQVVNKGQQIGTVRSYNGGNHLHFGINTSAASVAGYNETSLGSWVDPVNFLSANLSPLPSTSPTQSGNFTIQYYNNDLLQGNVIYTETVNEINKNWGTGNPGNGVNSDYFSARFTGNATFEQGFYNFHYEADDGIKVIIDDSNTIIDNGGPNASGNQGLNLSAGSHKIVVQYSERSGDARVLLNWTKTTQPTPTPIPSTPPTQSGNFTIQYYNNDLLQGNVIYTETANEINKNWGTGSPGNGVNSDYFSARFTGNAAFEQGYYNFHYEADDGIKVIIDDSNAIIDNGGPNASGNQGLNLSAGSHKIVVQYSERTGDARVLLNWSKTTQPTLTPQPPAITNHQVFVSGSTYDSNIWFVPQQSSTYTFNVDLNGWTLYNANKSIIDDYDWNLAPILQAGSKYCLTIYGAGYDRIFNIAFTPQVQISTVPVPAAPTGLILTEKTDTSVSLSWNYAALSTGYYVYENGMKMTSYPITSSSYTVSGLSPTTTYLFSVSAANESGESANCSTINVTTDISPAVPAAPGGLILASETDTTIDFFWNPVDGATGYNVYINGIKLTAYPITSTYYSAMYLTQDTPYFFHVTAVNDFGESIASSTLYVTTIAVQTAPTGKLTYFIDVPSGYMHEKAIKWAYDNNIAVGSNNMFGPEDNLTEAQFVVMLTKYGQIPYDETYAGSHFADKFYLAIKNKNLPLQGLQDVSIKDNPINRGRIAQIIAAVYGLNYSVDDAILFMYANNFSSGTSATRRTIETYGKDLPFIRAAAASFMQKMSSVTQVIDLYGNVIPVNTRQIIGVYN